MDQPKTLRTGRGLEPMSGSDAISILRQVQETIMQQNADKTLLRARILELEKEVRLLREAIKEMHESIGEAR